MTITASSVENWGTLSGVFLVAILTQYHAWKSKQATQNVAQDLADSTDRRDKALATIHALVNSAMAGRLRQIADLSQQLAEVTKNPVHQACADAALRDYQGYMERQSAIEQAIAASQPAVAVAVPLQALPKTNQEKT